MPVLTLGHELEIKVPHDACQHKPNLGTRQAERRDQPPKPLAGRRSVVGGGYSLFSNAVPGAGGEGLQHGPFVVREPLILEPAFGHERVGEPEVLGGAVRGILVHTHNHPAGDRPAAHSRQSAWERKEAERGFYAPMA